MKEKFMVKISANGYPLRENASLREKLKKLCGNIKFAVIWRFWSLTYRNGLSRSPSYHLMVKPVLRKYGFKDLRRENR